MAIEFFFAIIMVFLAIAWLVNYLNQAYETGAYVALRQERLMAAQIAGIANAVCATNESITFDAPCLAPLGRTVKYTLGSDDKKISVISGIGTANATALCPRGVDLIDPATGKSKGIACASAVATERQKLCAYSKGNGVVGISLGECGG